jgi:hypothetical protein
VDTLFQEGALNTDQQELVLLAFSVTLAQFAPFSVEHRPVQTMLAFKGTRQIRAMMAQANRICAACLEVQRRLARVD